MATAPFVLVASINKNRSSFKGHVIIGRQRQTESFGSARNHQDQESILGPARENLGSDRVQVLAEIQPLKWKRCWQKKLFGSNRRMVRIRRGEECGHFLLMGDTEPGKSALIQQMLDQVQGRGESAIISGVIPRPSATIASKFHRLLSTYKTPRTPLTRQLLAKYRI